VYEPGPGNQINDFNPGIAPSGLFWTTSISPEDVDVDFEEGSASMRVRQVAVMDFHAFGGGALPIPAIVSFHVHWSGVQERVRIRNVDQDFTGKFIRNQAQMEWSATTEEFSFASAPAKTSSSSFAELGHMRNGSFFMSE